VPHESTGNTSENTPDDSLDVLSFLQILFEEEIPNMSTLNSNLALKLIPSFDGRLDGLLKFVEMCDTVALTASPVDNSLLLSIIFSKLEGKAFEFSREATYADWPALKAALRRKFAQTKSIAQLQQELAQMKQTTTAEEYGASMTRTLKNLDQAVQASAGAVYYVYYGVDFVGQNLFIDGSPRSNARTEWGRCCKYVGE
jgi:hypothetical protein